MSMYLTPLPGVGPNRHHAQGSIPQAPGRTLQNAGMHPACHVAELHEEISMNTTLKLAAVALATSAVWTCAVAAPVTIQPADGKDTQIVDGNNAGQNFGNYTFVMDNWAGNNRSIGLLEFDLSAYTGASVTSAKMGLYHTFNAQAGSTYSVYRVTSAWNEATVTYSSAPTYDPTAVASLTINDMLVDVYREWDLTTLVSGWLSGAYANYGLWIEEVPVAGSGSAYFYSSDSNVANVDPYLKMDVTTNRVPEPGTLLLVGAALAVAGVRRRRR